MAKLDFKLKIDKEINKDIDVKPFLIILGLLILPIFYSIWTLYSYFEYSGKLEAVENRLVEENLNLKKIKHMVKFYNLRPQIEKKLIDQKFVDDYRIKQRLFSDYKLKEESTIECSLMIPKIEFYFDIDRKRKKIELPAQVRVVKFLRKKNILLMDKHYENVSVIKKNRKYFGLFSNVETSNLEVKFKKMEIPFNISKFTNEIVIDSLNEYSINIGTLETVVNYKNISEEVNFKKISGKLVIDTREPSNMVLPLTKSRKKKYAELKNKLKNLKLLREKCGEILLKKMKSVDEIKCGNILPLLFELKKVDKNRVEFRLKVSSKSYGFFEKITGELKKINVFKEFRILSISNKHKVWNMEILIFADLESVLND